MRHLWALLMVMVVASWGALAFAAEAVAESASISGPGVGALIWTFVNSPLGLSANGFILVFLLGKMFTAKPKWKVYADKYKPLLIAAVKKAEKEIDDDCANRSLLRLDVAMKFILAVDSKLDHSALKDAITAVHAEAEKDKNI